MVKILRKIISKKRSLYYHKLGIKIGKNSKIEKDVFIDPSFPWLVSIGNNVTIAPRTFILAHDGSTKKQIGYSKIGRVIIEDNVFIGANCTILPNVKIGQNSIIGAGSVVTKDIPENVLAVGNPARVISTVDEYKNKNKLMIKQFRVYENRYKRNKITEELKQEQISELTNSIGFID